MAYTLYTLGYRAGASSGAPVGSFYLGDSAGDFNSLGIEGDLGFAKDNNHLYIKDEVGWFRIPRSDYVSLSGDVQVIKSNPQLILDDPNAINVRLLNVGGQSFLSVNYLFNGSNWIKDNTGQSAGIFSLAPTLLSYLTNISGGPDAHTMVFQVNNAGQIYERGRTFPMGEWQDIPFNAANYYAGAGGGTWTVGAVAVISNRYTIIGRTVFISMYLSWFSGGNVIAGNVTELRINVPVPLASPQMNSIAYHTEAPHPDVIAAGQGPYISIYKKDNSAFSGAPFGMITNFTFAA